MTQPEMLNEILRQQQNTFTAVCDLGERMTGVEGRVDVIGDDLKNLKRTVEDQFIDVGNGEGPMKVDHKMQHKALYNFVKTGGSHDKTCEKTREQIQHLEKKLEKESDPLFQIGKWNATVNKLFVLGRNITMLVAFIWIIIEILGIKQSLMAGK